jgi:hypothetical protein
MQNHAVDASLTIFSWYPLSRVFPLKVYDMEGSPIQHIGRFQVTNIQILAIRPECKSHVTDCGLKESHQAVMIFVRATPHH